MYTIFQDAINAGGFDLNGITRKIAKYHIEGLLTDEQRDTLMETALEAGAPATPEQAEEWPLFVQPTGAHDAYTMGAKITFEGKRYTSLLAGNAYSPSVYPRGWQVQP